MTPRTWSLAVVVAAVAVLSSACGDGKKLKPAPDVLSISPTIGWNGASTSITIVGGPFKEGASASLDSDPKAEMENVVLVSDSRLSASIPSGIEPGTYDVLVKNPGSKKGRLEAGFTVTAQPPPAVTSVDPGTISNVVSNTVHVRGTGFYTDGSILPAVSIGSVAVSDVTFVDSTQLDVALDAGALAAGEYTVGVTNPDGQYGELTAALTVTDQPPMTIQTVSPSAVTVLQFGTAGILVQGTAFEDGLALDLMMGTTSGDPIVVAVNSTQIAFTVEPSSMALGLYDLTVTNPGGGLQAVAQEAFEVVDEPPPTITSVLPSSGFNGEPTTISVSGEEFISTPRIFLLGSNGSAEATNVQFISDTEVTAVVPAGLPNGLYDVQLSNPKPLDLSGTKVDGFRATDVRGPRIDSVSPDVLTQAGGSTTITGMYFDDTAPTAKVYVDANQDLVADAAEEITATVAATSISATVPGTLSIGTYPVIVVNDDGQSAFYFSISITAAAAGKLSNRGDWQLSSPLSSARQSHGTISLTDAIGNAYLYQIGGDNDGSTATAPLATGEVAPVSVFGDLGTASTLRQRNMAGAAIDNAMLFTREKFGLVKAGSNLYAIGGRQDDATLLDDVDRARILAPSEAPTLATTSADGQTGRLQSGTWYYRVSAWFAADKETLPSLPISVFAADGGAVSITWNRTLHPQIAATEAAVYHVYRALAADGAVGTEVYLGTVAGGAAQATYSFTDAGAVSPAPARVRAKGVVVANGTLPEGRYFYRISATVDGTETYAGYRAKGRVDLANDGENAILLTWPELPDATEYHIYRSEAADDAAGNEFLLDSIVAPASGIRPSYTDDGVLAVDTGVSPGAGSPFLAPGSLSGWIAAEALPTAREGIGAAAATGDNGQVYLYSIGGFDGANFLTDVQFTAVNANGSLMPWAATTAALATERSEMGISVATSKQSSFIAAGQSLIYAALGNNASGGPANVEGAFIDPATGDIGAWAVKSSLLSNTPTLNGLTANIGNSNFYLIAGFAGANAQNKINTACIFDTAGNLRGYSGSNCTGAAWTDSGSTLKTARGRHGSTLVRGYYFLTGGHDGTNVLMTTETLPQ